MSASSPRLDELRDKVRADPKSRYFLGLAEELRRAGEHAEALAVLDAGLAARPGQVAATVAKARCLIELDRPLDAWAVLEPLHIRDPTHLLAAKLAVEIFLAVGDVDRARSSLARYAPLGAADPDLVRMKAGVAELEAAARTAEARSTPASQTAAASQAAGPPQTATVAEDDEVVTVTLGNLYLLQGHRAEAERIFRRILRGDPDNAAARQALARALAGPPSASRGQDI